MARSFFGWKRTDKRAGEAEDNMLGWTRKLWLTLLLAAWALAVGGHDFLMQDHHHADSAPERAIVQAWHFELTPASTTPVVPVALVVLVAIQLMLARQQPGAPEIPPSRHPPPLSPELKTLWFRGPPFLTLPVQSQGIEVLPCVQVHSFLPSGLAGVRPGEPRAAV